MNDGNERMRGYLLRYKSGKLLPVNRKRAAGGNLTFVRALHTDRAEQAHLRFKKSGRRLKSFCFERV